MTRPRSLLTVVAAAGGAILCAMTQLAPAVAAPNPVGPLLPAGSGTTIVMDPRTGELRSITSSTRLADDVISQFEELAGPKTYTQDVRTGAIVSITRS